MDKITHKKLRERHEMIKKYGIVTDVILSSGLSKQTYYRAVRGDSVITLKTLSLISTAQQKVLNKADMIVNNL